MRSGMIFVVAVLAALFLNVAAAQEAAAPNPPATPTEQATKSADQALEVGKMDEVIKSLAPVLWPLAEDFLGMKAAEQGKNYFEADTREGFAGFGVKGKHPAVPAVELFATSGSEIFADQLPTEERRETLKAGLPEALRLGGLVVGATPTEISWPNRESVVEMVTRLKSASQDSAAAEQFCQRMTDATKDVDAFLYASACFHRLEVREALYAPAAPPVTTTAAGDDCEKQQTLPPPPTAKTAGAEWLLAVGVAGVYSLQGGKAFGLQLPIDLSVDLGPLLAEKLLLEATLLGLNPGGSYLKQQSAATAKKNFGLGLEFGGKVGWQLGWGSPYLMLRPAWHGGGKVGVGYQSPLLTEHLKLYLQGGWNWGEIIDAPFVGVGASIPF